jgi:hypothetical protein
VTVTTSTDAGPSAPSPDAPGTGRVALILGGHLLFYLLVWVGIGVVLFTVNLIGNGVRGDVYSSLWNGQSTVFQYAVLAGGIVVATGYLPRIVTNGVTRRAAIDGGLVSLVLLAVTGALLTTLVFAVEHVIFSINDWPHVLDNPDDLHIYDRPDQYALILVEVTALYLTHAVAGLVIGAAVFRFGWVWGAGYIGAGAALAIIAEYLVGSGFAGEPLGDMVGLEPPPVGIGLAGIVVVAVVGGLLARWLARGMPIPIGSASWWR